MIRFWAGVSVVAALLVASVAPVAGQSELETVPGEVVSVPILPDGAITVDGDFNDWLNIPAVETVDGPVPSPDPETVGLLRWQLAAQQGQLLVAATITDDQIIAGRNGENYWNEDSVELYVNFANPSSTEYVDGIAQLRISAVDRGNLDANQLTVTGVGASGFAVTGFVIQTTDGWGFEVAIPVPDPGAMANGEIFGFQIQANGSSGGDRDLKLNWSANDVDDTSFQDPSVFGQAVYLSESGDDAVAEVDELPETSADEAAVIEPAEAVEEAEVPAPVIEDTVAPPVVETPATSAEEERSGPLLIAAVVSAITVLLGGLWFENRRKKSEERAAQTAISTGLASEQADKVDEDEEFEELISSILDDDV